MFTETTSVGLDVHARSIKSRAINTTTGEITRSTMPNDTALVSGYLDSLAAEQGPVLVTYEAGPTGFELSRVIAEHGHRVQVAAPSKILRPAGDRVKTDARDALLLARLAINDSITPVRVPTRAQEAARDLVRAREDVRVELMAARHRLSKLLLRHGVVYAGKQAWGRSHDAWLRRIGRQVLPGMGAGVVIAFEDYYQQVQHLQARKDRLDEHIHALAQDSEFTDTITRLACLRGVSVLTATALAVEIGDWDRFTGAKIGAFLGLVPSEHSSGGSRWQGAITRTGNAHARRLLVEAAWHHKPGYRPGKVLHARWAKAPAAVVARADAGNRRLHRKWMMLTAAKKRHTVATTAVAREMAGWCWSLATMQI